MKARYLIFGHGFLGQEFSRHYGNQGVLSSVDITHEIALRQEIERVKPTFLINTAARTQTAALEKKENQEEGFRTNVYGPALLGKLTIEYGLRLLHLSTGMFYDGPQLASEDNLVLPTNYYSWTKAWAESVLQTFGPDAPFIIVRIHLPVTGSTHPRNLLHKICQFNRFTTTPSSLTVIPDFLTACDQLINLRAKGTFNIVNKGVISLMEIARKLQAAGLIPADQKLEALTRGQLDALGGAKQTFPVLSTEKLEGLGIHLPEVSMAVDRCIESLIKSS